MSPAELLEWGTLMQIVPIDTFHNFKHQNTPFQAKKIFFFRREPSPLLRYLLWWEGYPDLITSATDWQYVLMLCLHLFVCLLDEFQLCALFYSQHL